FWMWVMAFLGASTAYVESTLAQIYKEKDDQGRFRGGPAYYIEKAMGQRWYAWIFAAVTIIATGFLLPGVQANGIAEGMTPALGVGASALFISVRANRIAKFAELAVPFMALAYRLAALVIMFLNTGRVPALFTLVFESAFGMHAGFGAMLGLAVEWGVKRGI